MSAVTWLRTSVTSTFPASCGGTVAKMAVSSRTLTAASVPPKASRSVLVKPVPLITAVVPPASGPTEGAMAVSLGAGDEKVKPWAMVLDWPSGLVTVTSTVAGACGCTVTSSEPSPCACTLPAGAPPKKTCAPGSSPEPLTLTWVAESVEPVRGSQRVACGGAPPAPAW